MIEEEDMNEKSDPEIIEYVMPCTSHLIIIARDQRYIIIHYEYQYYNVYRKRYIIKDRYSTCNLVTIHIRLNHKLNKIKETHCTVVT